jgi:hypothetical protein
MEFDAALVAEIKKRKLNAEPIPRNDKKEKEPCGKPAKFIKDSKCYCLKHAKKMDFLLPVSEFKIAFLNKQKLNTLFTIADKYKIIYDKPCKKQNLIHLIQEFSNKNPKIFKKKLFSAGFQDQPSFQDF